MDYKKIISGLSDKEKADLAAKLTQAAMNTFSFDALDYANEEKMRLSITYAHMIFAENMRILESGEEPGRIPTMAEIRDCGRT